MVIGLEPSYRALPPSCCATEAWSPLVADETGAHCLPSSQEAAVARGLDGWIPDTPTEPRLGVTASATGVARRRHTRLGRPLLLQDRSGPPETASLGRPCGEEETGVGMDNAEPEATRCASAQRHGFERMQIRVCLVSPYPPPGTRHTITSSMGSYTKNLAEALVAQRHRVIVLAEQLQSLPAVSVDDGVHVVRCWRRGLTFPLRVVWAAMRHRRRFDVLHIQHEFFLYGAATPLLFPVTLLLLRMLARRPAVVTLHGVIEPSLVRTFAGQYGMSVDPRFLGAGLQISTKLTALFAKKLVTHEERLANVLVHGYGLRAPKIAVIPHGVEQGRSLVSQVTARKELGIGTGHVVSFLGYLAPYKGLEMLVEAVKGLDPQAYTLIIGGGENPRLSSVSIYRSFVARLKEEAARSRGAIRLLGYVREENLAQFLSAADVLVLPYTEVMASSGPMNLAASFGEPVLASRGFAGVHPDALLFEANPGALRAKIEEFFSSSCLRELAQREAARFASERSWPRIAQATHALYARVGRSETSG